MTFFFVSCVSGHREPFSTPIEPVRDLTALEQRLKQAAAASGNLSMREIGRVTYDGFQAPVWAVTRHDADDSKAPILINAGIHGNEPAGVEFAAVFVETLSQTPDIHPGRTVHIIPLINPWGWCHGVRYNPDGIDINRDFASLKSQESRIILDYIGDRNFLLMLDLHEDPSAQGFYLYQYGAGDKIAGQLLTTQIKEMGYPLEQNVRMAILKTRDGIIDAPMWGLWYVNITRQLSLANYYRLHSSKNVFTIETPISQDFRDRVHMQQTAVNMLIEHFAL